MYKSSAFLGSRTCMVQWDKAWIFEGEIGEVARGTVKGFICHITSLSLQCSDRDLQTFSVKGQMLILSSL